MKKCGGCKKTKVLNEFYKNKTKKDGRSCKCKICLKKYNKKYRKKNKLFLKQYGEKYRSENKEHIKELRQKYYQTNKLHIREHAKQYRNENRTKIVRSLDKYKYNLTPEQSDIVENLRINGKCFICCKKRGKQKLFLDHNHDTGEIRGILCNDCNKFEGVLKKQIELGLIEISGTWNTYLENPPGIEQF